MFTHLKETKQKYIDHFLFAFMSGLKLQIASITSIVHAFFPDIFPFTAENITKNLYNASEIRQRRRK